MMYDPMTECPEFKMDLFKSELIKFQRESGLSLEDFNKIVEYISIEYNSTDSKYVPPNISDNLFLAFNEWYYKFQKYSFGVSREYHDYNLENWHRMFVKDLVDQIYIKVSNSIINKYF